MTGSMKAVEPTLRPDAAAIIAERMRGGGS